MYVRPFGRMLSRDTAETRFGIDEVEVCETALLPEGFFDVLGHDAHSRLGLLLFTLVYPSFPTSLLGCAVDVGWLGRPVNSPGPSAGRLVNHGDDCFVVVGSVVLGLAPRPWPGLYVSAAPKTRPTPHSTVANVAKLTLSFAAP